MIPLYAMQDSIKSEEGENLQDATKKQGRRTTPSCKCKQGPGVPVLQCNEEEKQGRRIATMRTIGWDEDAQLE
jgi:hypothetical protein